MVAYECFDIAFNRFGGPLRYDFVLGVSNQVSNQWNIRLNAYSQTNMERLQDCIIYFHNGADSQQIHISKGTYAQQLGNWYDLAASQIVYIAIIVSPNLAGTSFIYTDLEMSEPSTGVHIVYKLTFEIS